MPNHVHCILFFPNDEYKLNKLISNGKCFIAYELVKRLKIEGHNKILMQMKEGLTQHDIKKGTAFTKYLKTALMQNLYIIDNFCYRK